MKISCTILTYNEASRIRIALAHARAWADEVVIIDKGSTDDTAKIAYAAGARVCQIPFSRQGHENIAEYAQLPEHDWLWSFTPGEVPTRHMIQAGKAAIGDGVDICRVPHRYYSFGVHSESSPWSVSYQPRLYNRRRVTFTGIAHQPLQAERIIDLPYGHDCFVLHQTHATAPDFMRSHADYMINEAENGTPDEVIERSSRAIALWQKALGSDPALLGQALGWRIYWLGVALHAWNRKHPDIQQDYLKRAQALAGVEWGALTQAPIS